MISAPTNAPDPGLSQHVNISNPQHPTPTALHSNVNTSVLPSASNPPPLSVIQSELILRSIPPTTALLSSSNRSAAATPKKKLVVACIGCRKKKIKCSSDRPACTNCLRLNIPCEYPVIRNRGSRFGYMEMLNRRMQHLEKYINCSTNPNYKPQFVAIHQKPERPAQLLYTSCGSTRGTVNSGYTNIKSNANLLTDLMKPTSTETDSLITQLGPTIHKELTPPPSANFLDSDFNSSGVASGATASASQFARTGQLPPLEIIIHLAELYFRSIHGQTYNFLHKPTFIPRIKQGKVNKTLLLALCGLTSRYSTHPAIATSIPYQAGEGFIAAARKGLSEQFDEPSLETVQALIFIVQNDFFKSKSKKSMIYVSLAIRMATTLELHLNSKDQTLSFREREERRRTYWSLVALDRLAHSAPHWQLQLRTDTIQIQLPCKDYYYENNIPVVTETLNGEYPSTAKTSTANNTNAKNCSTFSGPKSEKGMYAYIVIVTILWCDINKYVMEGYKNEIVPPWKEGSTYHSLETRLQRLIESIPKEYQYSKENLIVLDTTNQATALIHFHAQLRISLCSLSRSVYPFNYKVMKFEEQPPKAFLESAATSVMASANSLSSLIEDVLTIEDIHIAPFIGFGVFTVSSVHIANSFSSDPAIVQAAKDHLATNLKFLVMMREYFYSVGVWCIILKNRYFQKAKRHKFKANSSTNSALTKIDTSSKDENNVHTENDEESFNDSADASALRAREIKSENLVSGADGFSRPGTPPVAYAPEELMNIAANKPQTSESSSGLSSPKIGYSSSRNEEDMWEVDQSEMGKSKILTEKTKSKFGDDDNDDDSDLEKSRARTWKRALPKAFDRPMPQEALSQQKQQQQQQQNSATKQILSLFPVAKRLKTTGDENEMVLKKESPYSDENVPVSPSQFKDILTRPAFLHTRSASLATDYSKSDSTDTTSTSFQITGTNTSTSGDGDLARSSERSGLSTDNSASTTTNMKNVLLENSGEWLNSLELLGMTPFVEPKVSVPYMNHLTHWFGGKPDDTDSSGRFGNAKAVDSTKPDNYGTPKPKVEQPPAPKLDFGDDDDDDNETKNSNKATDTSTTTSLNTTSSNLTNTARTTTANSAEADPETPSLLDEIFGQVPHAILHSETSDSPESLSPSSLVGN